MCSSCLYLSTNSIRRLSFQHHHQISPCYRRPCTSKARHVNRNLHFYHQRNASACLHIINSDLYARARVYFLFIAYLFPRIVTVTGMVDIALVRHDFLSLSPLRCYQNANRRVRVCACLFFSTPSLGQTSSYAAASSAHRDMCTREENAAGQAKCKV